MGKVKIIITSSPELKVDAKLINAETARKSGLPYVTKLENGRTVIKFPARNA